MATGGGQAAAQPGTAALSKRIAGFLRSNGSRVVLHVDLDAFYAQVEMVRTGSPEDQPLCVQQWQGLIAVNYPARAKGIKRHCTVQEALALCPDIKFVHVATYSKGDHEARYHEDPKYATHKVSLKPYRQASARIFSIIERFVPPAHGVVERASIDEAYAELTEIVNRRIVAKFCAIADGPNGIERATAAWEALEYDEDGPEVEWGPDTCVVGLPDPPKTGDENESTPPERRTRGWQDYQLAEAASLVLDIRQAIRNELGYTCSAGIGSNKMLAKLVSALNKPAKQTALRTGAVLEFMRDLPFTKIRNLGGKFGEEVEAAYGAKNVSDLWKYSREQLQTRLGAQPGSWLYDAVRGVNSDEVVRRNMAQTMMAAKSFRPSVTSMEEVKHWLDVLGWEIHDRITEDFEANGRWAKTLVLHLKSPSLDKSRTCAFPPRHMCDGDIIAARALEMIKSEGEAKALPLMRCSLSAGGLFGDKGNGTIARFFGKKMDATADSGKEGAHVLEGDADVGRLEADGCEQDEDTDNPDNKNIATSSDLNSTSPSIKSFFASKPAIAIEETEEVPESFTCSRCGKSLLKSQQSEHEDYHFALDLSKESRVVLGGAGSGSGGSSVAGVKRKQPPGRSGTSDKKLTSFFKRE